MSETSLALKVSLAERLDCAEVVLDKRTDEVTIEVPAERLREVAEILKTDDSFAFKQLTDLCAVDYLAYGDAEWDTESASNIGFSRGVSHYDASADPDLNSDRRFAVVYHLLSITHNLRMRMKVFAAHPEFPVVDSITDIWPAANWFEREAFDLMGIHFDGHPDLRRILTDYGFVGHPFRKDFPLIGNVEVWYDPEQGRVVYEPVSIEPRVLVPKVIRAAKGQDDDPKIVTEGDT